MLSAFGLESYHGRRTHPVSKPYDNPPRRKPRVFDLELLARMPRQHSLALALLPLARAHDDQRLRAARRAAFLRSKLRAPEHRGKPSSFQAVTESARRNTEPLENPCRAVQRRK